MSKAIEASEFSTLTNEAEILENNINKIWYEIDRISFNIDFLTRSTYLAGKVKQQNSDKKNPHILSSFRNIETEIEGLTTLVNINAQDLTISQKKQLKVSINNLGNKLGELAEVFIRTEIGHIGTIEKLLLQKRNPSHRQQFTDLKDWERSLILPIDAIESAGEDFIKFFIELIKKIQEYKEINFETIWSNIEQFLIEQFEVSNNDIHQLKISLFSMWNNYSTVTNLLHISRHEQVNIAFNIILGIIITLLLGGAVKKSVRFLGQTTAGTKGEKVGSIIGEIILKINMVTQTLVIFSLITQKIDKINSIPEIPQIQIRPPSVSSF